MANRNELMVSIAAEAAEWRRELHRNPQTMYAETFASDFICSRLAEWGIPFERGIAGTGVVASIEGRRNQSNDAIAFRSDMDALDLVEESGQHWSSQTTGKMHGCGHDGHMATLLTLGKYLKETRNFDGIVQLIFQPAEEGGRGAIRMLEEGLLERFPFREIYGFHNWPMLPRGVFAIRSGPMLAAVDVFEIRLTGKGGHAAMPNLCCDVVPAMAQVILAMQTLVTREADPMSSAVVSVTNVVAGSGATNVISGKCQLSGTVRTFCQDVRNHIEDRMRALTLGIANAFRVSSEVRYHRVTEPVINHEECTFHSRAAAVVVAGEGNVRLLEPMMGGEDFGAFLQVRPGAFIVLGQAGDDVLSPHNRSLHSPQYDFNDAIIPIAAEYFTELTERRLPVY